MREPRMNLIFPPRHADHGGASSGAAKGSAGPDTDGSAPGVGILSPALLARHGGRVLDPVQAAAIPGWPVPRTTAYRARTLLIPADLLEQGGFVDAINAVLRRIGIQLIPPPPGRGQEPDGLRRLPRVAVLAPALSRDGTPPLPVVIDAWVALQALRAAAVPTDQRTAGAAPAGPDAGQPGLTAQDVRQIALEHLLVGSAIDGAPIWHGSGLAGGPGGSTDGGAASTESYLFSGGDARTPVTVCLDAPPRMPGDACAAEFGRRPVVAVLDTGVRAHDWLDVTPNPPGSYHTEADGFVAVDPAMQAVIHAQAEISVSAGDRPRHLIKHPWDTPITAEPLVGDLDTDTGHCTFIAGIVRQVAPDAQVLAIRVTHSDGVIYEGDLICALGQLAGRVAMAEAGDVAGLVDVVSLSLGYFSESAADVAFSSGLWQVIELLLDNGVAVVAAAGNFATRRRFYPAAFSLEPRPSGRLPLISVGALNPNGSAALFSDGGQWITAWAPGGAVVSTFPTDINASRNPEITMPSGKVAPGDPAAPAEREALDPDDYSGGFAIWSGTSFSAPLVAARIAKSLLAGAADLATGLRLDKPGAQAATDRALAALQDLGWQG
jgi:Subtilase family